MTDNPFTDKDRARADDTIKRLGIAPDDPYYPKCYDIALRGFPAWRIAQHLNLSREQIAALGGPCS